MAAAKHDRKSDEGKSPQTGNGGSNYGMDELPRYDVSKDTTPENPLMAESYTDAVRDPSKVQPELDAAFSHRYFPKFRRERVAVLHISGIRHVVKEIVRSLVAVCGVLVGITAFD